jgi:hypothetical protein
MFHVVVMPTANPDIDLIRQIALNTSQPLYQVRMLFAGPLPKIIAHPKEEALATAMAGSLRLLGLQAFSISDGDLKKPPQTRFLANKTEIAGDSVKFISRTGETQVFSPTDVFLLLAGRRTTPAQHTETITRIGLNLPATLLTGGLPIMKRSTSGGPKQENAVEGFIRLYGSQSDDPLVEVRQHDCDYSSLGSEMACTTKTNFAVLLESLRRFFSHAFFDQNLLNGFPLASRTSSGADPVEENCRLLFRYYLATGTATSGS